LLHQYPSERIKSNKHIEKHKELWKKEHSQLIRNKYLIEKIFFQLLLEVLQE
jgi:hypothetical protein